MDMSTSEKIRTLIKRNGLTLAKLAERTSQSRQNLGNKMALDDFRESELKALAEAMGYNVEVSFVSKQTGERF